MPVVVLCLGILGVVASTPSSAAPIHGRGITARAGFYANVLEHGRSRIQIFDRLCRNPERRRACTGIRPGLKLAIDRAVERPISWVDRPQRARGVFWILAPVRFANDEANVRWAWRDLRPFGCAGGGQVTYQHHRATWRISLGFQYEGCP